MKKRHLKVFLIIILILYFPTLVVKGMRITFTELFAYFSFAYYFVIWKNKTPLQKYYLQYFLMYLFLILFTASINYCAIDKSNIFVLRKIFVSYIYAYIFYDLFDKSVMNTKFLTIMIFLLFSPNILTLLQSFIPVVKTFTYDIYKPTYYYNPTDLGTGQQYFQVIDYRSCSVFKDFFSFANYNIVLGILIFYRILVEKQKSNKFMLIILYVALLIVQIFVARISLLLIPFSSLLISVIYFFVNKKIRILKMIIIYSLAAIIAFLILFYLLKDNPKYEWAFEVFYIFREDKIEDFSSFNSSLNNNRVFFENYFFSLKNWLKPLHSYDVYIQKFRATVDNFYLQEIVRFGIYGILSLIFLFYHLLKKYNKNIFIFSSLLVLIISNYKGGNTVFLDKLNAIYPMLCVYFIKKKELYENSFYN